MEETKARSWELIGCCRLLWLSRIPLGRIPSDVDTIDADLLARGMSCNDDTPYIRSARRPQSNEMGETTLGGHESRMGQKSVRVAGVLQLGGYLGPSAVRILVQQSNYARSGDADQGRFIRWVERTNWPPAEGGVCPPAIQFGRLVKSMYLAQSDRYPCKKTVVNKSLQNAGC